MTATTAEERAELARLLDHVDLPLEVRGRDFQVCAAGGGQWADTFGSVTDAALIARAINALPSLLADLDAAEERAFNAENVARLAEESEAGWRREADELAERVAAVEALADEWEATGPAWIDPPIGAATELRAALTTTPTPAAEVGRREESGR